MSKLAGKSIMDDNNCGEILSLRVRNRRGGYDEIVHVCMRDRHSHGYHRSGDGTEWLSRDPRFGGAGS